MRGPHAEDTTRPAAGLADWFERRLGIVSAFRAGYIDFLMPRNLNWLWNFGAILSVVLVVMMLTGLLLAVHYTPTSIGAFASVEAIDRQVPSGWLLHSLHAVGSSLFLGALYIHLFRGLYYGSYKEPRELLWLTGVVLLCLVMAASFAGYVLPWGQMSYWGVGIVGKALAAMPYFGEGLQQLLLGGDAPGDATLHRLFVLHFLVAFMVVAIVVGHVMVLHVNGSGNPAGTSGAAVKDRVSFHPYYTAKDGAGLAVFLLVFAVLVFFFPDLLSEAENYRPANPLHTPADIAPQWYFLPFYGILQAVPSRLGGLAASAGAVLILFAVPWLDRSPLRPVARRPLFRASTVMLVIAFVMLGLSGRHHAEGIWMLVGRVATVVYYAHFLLVLPLCARMEHRQEQAAGGRQS